MRVTITHSALIVLLSAAGALSNPAVAPITVIGTAIATAITRIPATTTTTTTTPILIFTGIATAITRVPVVTTTTTTTKPTTTTTSTKPTTTSTLTTKPTASPTPSISSVIQTTSVSKNSTTITSTSTARPSTTAPIDTGVLTSTRTTNILANITGLPPFPTNIVEGTKLNLTDIQGDILVGMQKKKEVFYFFTINNAASFKKKLHYNLVGSITSTYQLLYVSLQPIVALNLAFTYTGLQVLGYGSTLADQPFTYGQWADANNLRDTDPKNNWVPQFQGTKIHGVFLIASDQQAYLDAQISVISTLFGSDITNVYSLQGGVRPGAFEGHEMFGFLDGIGQPAVNGFHVPLPGQQIVEPGLILAGESGDTLAGARPSWAKDGSFMVFRQLKQLVKEWDDFIFNNAPAIPGWTQAQSAELLGARMIGRWKSGAPIDKTPTVDNPPMGHNIYQNNDFDYTHSGYSITDDQFHCPFAAHIRKTRPRADLQGQEGYTKDNGTNVIMRAGIPYGPEPGDCGASYSGTCDDSAANDKVERGLAFVAYQSQIAQGFQFIQNVWANDPNFAPGKNVAPGFDPTIGQNGGAPGRFMSGYDILNPTNNLNLFEEFVISRGGEYFFSPSIQALANVLSV